MAGDGQHERTLDAAAAAGVRDVMERIVGALAPQPVDRPDAGAALVNDLGYHSLRLVELTFVMEDLFGMVPMALEEAPPIGTVGELVAFVLDKIASGAAALPDEEAVEAAFRQLPTPDVPVE